MERRPTCLKVKSNNYFAQFFRMSCIYERKGYFISLLGCDWNKFTIDYLPDLFSNLFSYQDEINIWEDISWEDIRSGISLFKVKCVIVVKGNILWNYFLKIIYRDNISNRIFFGKNVFILCLKDKSIVLIHLQEFAKVTCSSG